MDLSREPPSTDVYERINCGPVIIEFDRMSGQFITTQKCDELPVYFKPEFDEWMWLSFYLFLVVICLFIINLNSRRL